MKDIEIVLENLASLEIKPDKEQQLFLETFIQFEFHESKNEKNKGPDYILQ